MEGRSAAEWIIAILGGTMYRILPGWLNAEDALVLSEMLLDGDVSDEELDQLIRDVMTVAAGRTYWWAMNIIGVAAANNESWAKLNGQLILGGVQADRISLAAWVDAMYAVMVRKMDQEAYNQFSAHIEAPPKGAVLDEAEESDAFMSLLGSTMEEM